MILLPSLFLHFLESAEPQTLVYIALLSVNKSPMDKLIKTNTKLYNKIKSLKFCIDNEMDFKSETIQLSIFAQTFTALSVYYRFF